MLYKPRKLVIAMLIHPRQLAVCVVLVALAGCGQAPLGHERYVPNAATARDAVDEALAAWKRGEPAGSIKRDSAAANIEVSDSRRKPGQKLVDYQILGEIAAEGPRSFAVKLFLENPRQERSVRYYVVGIDPLWVFNQRDYELIVHWEGCEEDEEDEEIAIPAQPVARSE